MSHAQFVKAKTTTVSPEKSRMQIEQMLRRYGAVGFSFSADLAKGEVRVEFVVPDSAQKGAAQIPVRIPVKIHDVHNVLYKQKAGTAVSIGTKEWERAERVAWRILALWIDAALSAATLGVRSIAETFAGDRLVTDDAGNTMRVTELLERANGSLPHGGRLLLLGGKDR